MWSGFQMKSTETIYDKSQWSCKETSQNFHALCNSGKLSTNSTNLANSPRDRVEIQSGPLKWHQSTNRKVAVEVYREHKGELPSQHTLIFNSCQYNMPLYLFYIRRKFTYYCSHDSKSEDCFIRFEGALLLRQGLWFDSDWITKLNRTGRICAPNSVW